MGLDYYAILDVPRKASTFDIKMAYRNLALRLHPERKMYPQHPNPRPEDVFDLPLPTLPESTYWEVLNEAYDVLSNALRREIYDQYGEECLKRGVAVPNGFIPAYRYHGEPLRTYFEFFGSYSPYCDMIDAVTNPPKLYSTKQGKGVKNKDLTVEKMLFVKLEEVFHGGIKCVKILRHEFVHNSKTKTEVKECSLSIPIAPGILEGTRITFPEASDQSLTRIPADIVFIVTDKPHKVFRRDKSDLRMEKCITLREALTGFKLKIDTIDDRKLEIMVTDVTDFDYTTRIPGEGLPFPHNNRQKGDLIINYKITFPPYVKKSLREKLNQVFDEIDESLQVKEPSNVCQDLKKSSSSLSYQ